jgi:hypothetical protein
MTLVWHCFVVDSRNYWLTCQRKGPTSVHKCKNAYNPALVEVLLTHRRCKNDFPRRK